LSTANRSRVSMCYKHFSRDAASWVVDGVKTFLSTSLLTMQNFVAMCHTMWTYVGRRPNNLWTMVSVPLVAGFRPKSCLFTICLRMPNSVILGQTVWA